LDLWVSKDAEIDVDLKPISAELYFFQPILMRLSEKIPFGNLGIPLCFSKF
jgi:hypothetical protein